MKLFFHRIQESPLWIYLSMALIAMIILIWNCARVWSFTADDSFITFRYAVNLGRGLGPNFNQVPPRAEGYTSVLWMLCMVLPHLGGFGVLDFAKISGVLAVIGTQGWMGVFLWHAGPAEERVSRMAAGGLAALFLALLPETAVHAVSGMETAGYLFLLTGLATLAYLAITGRRWAADWLPAAALLAGLMRPEANLVAVLALAAVYLRSTQRRRLLLRTVLIYLIPGATYFLWRWHYFGVLLPLPFYIKTGGAGLPGLSVVGPFVIFLLANLGLYLGIGLLGEPRAVRLILLMTLPDLLFFLFSFPEMDYDYRFVYPLLPLFLVLAGMGLAMLVRQAAAWPAGRRWARYVPAWVAVLALVIFAAQNLPRERELFTSKLDYARGSIRAHYAIGHALSEVAHTADSPVLAVTDAGAIPYYAGWHTIDVVGLNDAAIALRRVRQVDYVFAHDPEILVLVSNSLQAFQSDSTLAKDLYQRAQAQGMVVTARIPFYQGDSVWVMARPGSEADARLRARFPQGK